nr:reverse transcriptase domain-containing protein [Tanacetum cinerariifolium]
MERKIDEWLKSQNVSLEQTDSTDPPSPLQAHTEHVNVVFTRSRKYDDSPKIQKDPPPPIIINNKIKKDKTIKTSKNGYQVVKTKEYPFLTLENLYPMDNKPMWATDRVVALTLSFVITILETANEFAIKAGVIFLYKTPNQAYQLLKDKVLLKLDWAKNQKTKSSLKKIVAFTDEGSSNSDTNKIMARMDAMTLKWISTKNSNLMLKKLNPILM